MATWCSSISYLPYIKNNPTVWLLVQLADNRIGKIPIVSWCIVSIVSSRCLHNHKSYMVNHPEARQNRKFRFTVCFLIIHTYVASFHRFIRILNKRLGSYRQITFFVATKVLKHVTDRYDACFCWWWRQTVQIKTDRACIRVLLLDNPWHNRPLGLRELSGNNQWIFTDITSIISFQNSIRFGSSSERSDKDLYV